MASLKQRLLTPLRAMFKIPTLEKWLVNKTQGKTYGDFYVKLLPSNRQYATHTYRTVQREGINYRLDISDYMEYTLYFGIKTEPREVLYNLIKDGITVFDIGTNIGETLLNFAKRNPQGQNYGFEPVPYLYERAKHNLSLNNFENIVLNNLALSNKTESLFFQKPNNNNSGGIALSKQANPTMQEVKAVTLDDFIALQQITKLDFIKIDVEGFEMNVLKGGIESIKKYQPILFIELDDNNLKRQKHTAKKLVTLLIDLGYHITRADTQEHITENYPFANTHFDIICRVN